MQGSTSRGRQRKQSRIVTTAQRRANHNRPPWAVFLLRRVRGRSPPSTGLTFFSGRLHFGGQFISKPFPGCNGTERLVLN
jgi:hypothetical protein